MRKVPSAMKEQRGNPGHRPLPVDEPKPELGADMPEGLSKEAQKHWPTIADQLAAVNVLTRMDATALAIYCEQHARYMKAKALLERHGLTMITHTGHLVKRPEIDIMDGCHDRMLKLLIECGMTPASRTKVKSMGDAPKKNKFASIRRGKSRMAESD